MQKTKASDEQIHTSWFSFKWIGESSFMSIVTKAVEMSWNEMGAVSLSTRSSDYDEADFWSMALDIISWFVAMSTTAGCLDNASTHLNVVHG